MNKNVLYRSIPKVDILLADEPTGALDSDTSVQVMELLKEVAKERLVVMVTHNPELAETINRISAAIDTDTMQQLNAKVDIDKEEYDDVAAEFYASL